MPLEDRPLIRSRSTKYDGSIHYEFDTRLVDHRDGCLRLWVDKHTPNRSYRGDGRFEDHAIACFFPGDENRAFNVFHYLNPYPRNGLVMAADILTNVRLEDGTLRWIDLDLDVEVSADGRVELVDEDEFEEHQVRYRYPDPVIAEAEQSAALALDLARRGEFPFDHERQLIDLRSLVGTG